ncbi:MAG: PaaI family thioesterase [Methylococcaceae bacterium]|nr:PaaI family thioesterase [Methylococcaceae bacterium]
MDVSQLPFNRLIGLELADHDSGFLVYLPDHPQYTNHLGTIHGSALMAVAEAGSGAFLSEQFKNMTGLIPVVRRLETKFRRPASGKVSARCKVEPNEIARWSSELTLRGRLSVSIPVEVVDASDLVVMTAVAEWFITLNT